jgi:hypothetical protein
MTETWTNKANSILLNRKIVKVRYLTDLEQEAFGWYNKCVVIELDDKTILFPSSDDEGNSAGALHYLKGENIDVLPTIQ